MIEYAVLPVLIAVCLVVRKRTPVCLLCGILIFFFLILAGSGWSGLEVIYRMLPQYPVSMIYRFSAPIGFLFPAKLLSMLFPDPFVCRVVFSAVCVYGTMSYIYRYCEAPAAAALLAAGGGFIAVAADDPCLYIALLLCAFAYRHICERRFVRFAALVLLASCFCFDAILMLLLYPVFWARPGLVPMFIGGAVCGLVIYFGAFGYVFGFMYGEPVQPSGAGLSPAMPTALGIFCVWAGLMNKMLAPNRKIPDYNDTMTVSIFIAAFLSLCCVYDIRLLPLTLMCAFPPALTLGSALVKASGRLISLTFRERKKIALAVFSALGLALLGVWYCLAVSGGAL